MGKGFTTFFDNYEASSTHYSRRTAYLRCYSYLRQRQDDGSNYYLFGSHLATAKSSDMLNWTYFGGGETDACTLFANTAGVKIGYANAYNTQKITSVKNYKGETVSFGNFNAHSWQSIGNNVQGMQWAPDVVRSRKTGKWLMYMSVNGDNWASSIVCLAADNIEGPYVYQGPVVFSGFQGRYDHNGFTKTNDWTHTDLSIATGATSLPARYNTDRWGSYWPNCIDPCVFYDEEGNLLMSYGSWSGGIWELKLDETTGLRDYTHTYPYEINGKKAPAILTSVRRSRADTMSRARARLSVISAITTISFSLTEV